MKREEWEGKAKRIVSLITERLKDDWRFQKADYNWTGWSHVDFSMCSTECPNFRFITGEVDIDKLDDSIADEFVERWNSEYSHEAIDSLNEFVRNILRWGCG